MNYMSTAIQLLARGIPELITWWNRKQAVPGIPEGIGTGSNAHQPISDADTLTAPLHLKIKELHARNGTPWGDVNIFGVRDETDIEKDVWNDIIVAVIGEEVRVFSGTTDPGVYWTDDRNRRKAGWEKGCAHLCLGYHKNAYKVGKHRGYEALVQWGNKVKIWRDLDADFEQDDNETVKSGWFGINIHHGYDARSIGKASAGCQVIRKKSDFLEFMAFVKTSPRYRKSKSARFSYMLYEKAQVPFLEELRVLAEK